MKLQLKVSINKTSRRRISIKDISEGQGVIQTIKHIFLDTSSKYKIGGHTNDEQGFTVNEYMWTI